MKKTLWWVWIVIAVAFIVTVEMNGAHPFTFEWLQ